MMLRVSAAIVAVAFVAGGPALAVSLPFEDMNDTWGGFDAVWIGPDHPLTYTHDLTDEIDFAAGWTVTEATLELDFTNDLLDGTKLWGLIQWDNREFVRVACDGQDWVEIGEVDDGQHSLVVDIDWINDNGSLDVTVSVWNELDTATAWLDHSRLYGTKSLDEPVVGSAPEPVTLCGLGLGVGALVRYSRRRR